MEKEIVATKFKKIESKWTSCNRLSKTRDMEASPEAS